MHSERLPSSRKLRFKIIEACDKKIKEIDKQKETSLQWHISKMEKIRNKKWKSLVGPAPVQKEIVEIRKQEDIPPDVAMTKATSFYAWGDTNTGHNRSIITSTKPPDDLLDVTTEDIAFSEVTKFYEEGTEPFENHNSLLRLYPKEPTTPPKRQITRTHIYIPRVDKEGRVVREGATNSVKEQVNDNLVDLQIENGINLEKFKENLQRKIPQFGKTNKIPDFPEPILTRPRQSLAELIHRIEQRKARIPNIRSRSNSRLSQALREIEDEPTTQTDTAFPDDELAMCLDNGSISTEELSNARICSLLEREDISQNSTLFIKGSDNHLSKLSSLESVKRRDGNLNLSLNDMEQLHYVRKLGNREVAKHDTNCGCDRYSNSSQSKRSLCSNSGMELY